jgi:hypothetical protein
MRIVVMTSDKSLWCLQGFAYQWQKYCGWPVEVCGFSKPDFKLPENFRFYSLGKFEDYPARNWSDALLEVFSLFQEEQIAIFLEDYFLVRQIPQNIFHLADTFMKVSTDAIRFDLTSDRLYSGNIRDVGHFENFDIIQSFDSPYQISLQAAVWNKSRLKELIEPGMSPWEIEMVGSKKMEERPDLKVYGTRQWPVRYQIMVRAGELDLSGDWMVPPRQLSRNDLEELKAYGLLNKE